LAEPVCAETVLEGLPSTAKQQQTTASDEEAMIAIRFSDSAAKR